MSTPIDVILCKWCGIRPARVAEIRFGHYRCSQCRRDRHRDGYARWGRTYDDTHLERHAAWSREKRKRIVRIAGTTISFPTVELKQQAVELIARSRNEFKQRQQSRAQSQAHAADAVPIQARP